MELLSKEEAWQLFLDIVGHGVSSVPNLNPIVQDIVKECAHLPLAIVIVAGSLKGNVDRDEWKTALEELRACAKGPYDMGNTVMQKLKLSFGRLKDKKLQECLLYCALYPEDSVIRREDLIKYLIDEGIIEGMDSRRAEVGKGHSMLNKLENACLLEGSSNKFGYKCVKMHDLVRDMALNITGTRYLVEAGIGSEDIPENQKWIEDLIMVSLMCNRISDIPSNASPKCPMLSTLILRNNKLLEEIPDCFFMYMKNLNILDLSYTNIKILPTAISHLMNLTALLLRGCKRLEHVPSLAKVRALRRLDCWRTGIEEVPQGLEMLVNLRYLNLQTKLLKRIPDGVLPKLSHLQHLSLPRYFSRTLKVNVEELASLRKLETFEAMFHDVRHFNSFVKSMEGREMISIYMLHVGFHYFQKFYRCNRGVILTHCILGENVAGNYCPLLLPQGIQILHIMNCVLASLCRSFASLKDAIDLRFCILSECHEMEYVLYSSSFTVSILQRLEELELDRLWNLRALVRRDTFASWLLPIGTFSSLKKLSVIDCPNLKSLFVPALLSHLQNLEEIKVHKCEQMVHLIAARSDCEDHDNANEACVVVGEISVSLPKLRLLRLWGLPELKSISNCEEADLVVDSLEEILVLKCPNLKRIDHLFGNEPLGDRPASLQKIKVEKNWWESLEWGHSNSRDLLQPLCKFQV
ncbi:hypothetical protein TIFTF001_045807 [Ficus carica]|uniref:NB-ARC domain-containing protein n=1 Tax=Ficus carica TaxID=3494 RepID=A0AA88CJL6_FICCA|nr:hypothetical protein TIFTF001_045807 [Ficus carica]